MEPYQKTEIDSQLRQFGIVLSLLLAGAGTYLLRDSYLEIFIVVTASCLVCAAFWRQWRGTKAFFRVWMWVAERLAKVMTTALLTAIYFLVLTPLALVARLGGHRFLQKEGETRGGSYWVRCKTDVSTNSCRKQY